MEVPSAPSAAPVADTDSNDTAALANSMVLTRDELLKRRSHRLRQLAKIYRHHYWALMEDVRLKHREYYWQYGKSPLDGEIVDSLNRGNNGNGCGDGESSSKLGLGFDGGIIKCAVTGCSTKAMALTNYCHAHIMLDSNQMLYKGCKFALRSSSETDQGAILCGKPILRSTTPPLCPLHSQKTEKTIRHLFRKGGLSVNLSIKLSSKIPCVLTEYVSLIQSRRRRAARQVSASNPSN